MTTAQPSTTAAIDALTDATTRLAAAVDRIISAGGPNAFAAPSLLPDWTIGHLVTHLARNADGLRRVLTAAQAGRRITPYDSPQARATGIQVGAQRDTATIASDFRTSTVQLADTIGELPQNVWQATVDLGRGGPTTADVILAARLGEVELHHHDLGVDGGLALLDDGQANHLLLALIRSYVRTREVSGLILEPGGGDPIVIGDGGQRISGADVDLVSWLSGRSDGAALQSEGPLPELPSW